MTVAMIIQARINSTRLPGKVLKKLAGHTVLEHTLKRCLAIKGVDVVCCAIPTDAKHDPVADEASGLGVYVFRGSEDDVLDRYYQAARELKATTVMRVTSDCPLIDPQVTADVLALFNREKADYATNNMPPSWPHGLDCEVMSFAWLERSAKEAKEPFEREHVSQYVRNHVEAKQVNLTCSKPGVNKLRWTLDNPNDYTFLTAVFERMPQDCVNDPKSWDWRIPLKIVNDDPALTEINTGQDRWEGLKKSINDKV